ncbi:uncharacterized protein LOC124896540 [Capsicum annuum]|uniref:uncharacterized protein LOC124896540 n=1 Tax=Capsicum annuum TaxID=4072 RepID=UPI001FB1A0F5|nr:uncharacterized protein LOC124896540 [Capsicum annuum]
MMKALMWNIRSVKSQKAFQRLQMLHNFNKFAFITLLEPFQHTTTIQRYRNRLKMPLVVHNLNGKIWFFANHGFDVTVVSSTEQHLSVLLKNVSLNTSFLVPSVFAKCNREQRLTLWEDILALSNELNTPWIVGGDFNVVLNGEEKIGGLPVSNTEVNDFRMCIESSDLMTIPFKGSPFTWWNGRAGMDLEHLARDGSDHAPLMLTCENRASRVMKPFRFLKFWTDHETFKDVRKIKQVKSALSLWSKEIFGDIFQQLLIREEIAKIKEKLFEDSPTQENQAVMQRAKAEYTKYLHLEESYWQQKVGYDWFESGDRNTKFFHSIVKGRRNRLKVSRIMNDAGNWLEDEKLIADEALINEEENADLEAIPDEEELKKAVFSLNGDSACGPDGLSGRFYQSCWEIVRSDIIRMVRDFYADIGKRGKPENVVLKLDMAKAYDRVSWFFLMKVLTKMGFSSRVVDLGVKQGDPLSPALFILSAEVLTRALNLLFEDISYNTSLGVWQQVEKYTGIAKGEFPLKYLGNPISHTKKSKEHYVDLLDKVRGNLQAWKDNHQKRRLVTI